MRKFFARHFNEIAVAFLTRARRDAGKAMVNKALAPVQGSARRPLVCEEYAA